LFAKQRFCNGAAGVKSLVNAPRRRARASFRGRRAVATSCGQTNRASQSKCAWSDRFVRRPTPLFAASLDLRPCDGTSLSKSAVPSVIPPLLCQLSGDGFSQQLCSSGNRCHQPTCDAAAPPACVPAPLCPLQTAQLCDPQRPRLQDGESRDATEDNVRCFKQGGSYHRIADLADPHRPVHLAGLIPFGVRPKYGPTSLDLQNLVGSSIAILYVTATTAPAEIFGTRLNRRMRGKLATVIDRIEHGHHVFRAYLTSGRPPLPLGCDPQREECRRRAFGSTDVIGPVAAARAHSPTIARARRAQRSASEAGQRAIFQPGRNNQSRRQ
jgi:hypothetical protein